ncbi:MAG TPA: hypothetical protein VE981_20500 [Planctomycetota bacterium]|nr:hypothetical protein [Planctomycetota bacterium]
MMKSRSLYLAVAVFTLAVQAMAAGHTPAFHDEPVSRCHDQGKHFCPEQVEQETGSCVLCNVSLNGVFLERLDNVDTAPAAEPVVVVFVAPFDSAPADSAHAPRGPPVG